MRRHYNGTANNAAACDGYTRAVSPTEPHTIDRAAVTCPDCLRLMEAPIKAPDGWTEVETGGGCTAWQRDFYDRDSPGRRVGEALITVDGDPSAPTRADEPVTLGIYDANQSICAIFDCDNVAQALLIASKFQHWI